MPAFDPTRAPAGRLTRLGVVLDVALPPSRLAAVARMCGRAGIDAVWLSGAESHGDEGDVLEAGRSLAGGLERSCLGLMVFASRQTAGALAAEAAGLARSMGVALELSLVDGGPQAARFAIELAAELAARLPAATDGPRIRLSATARAPEDVPALSSVVDDLVLAGWDHADLETAADAARFVAAEAGRDPSSLGVAALVPVSIGRTGAEATARADLDPRLSELGHPADIGIFGTLEECQDRVIALAHAGITDLRCRLPDAADVHDVIAQLTAMAIGTTEVLQPGALRSPAPPPPEGWGGRSPRSTRPSISDGSRRR